MCSGCGRCGKVESGHHSVVASVAPSVDLIQLASPAIVLQTKIIAASARVPDLVDADGQSARQ